MLPNLATGATPAGVVPITPIAVARRPPIVYASELLPSSESIITDLIDKAYYQCNATGIGWQHQLLMSMEKEFGGVWQVNEVDSPQLPVCKSAMANSRMVFSPNNGKQKYCIYQAKQNRSRGHCRFCCF
ncbi:unnamed protein product [Protopolystoma xenopodis]|uniref:Uncharacterized protein n=1 Tax=Protopolystoma xenopodis TaxID=117903 RepID=A0A448WRL4_9PLAT|nr:unnamed protein product [Protopolystoma xenopodis]